VGILSLKPKRKRLVALAALALFVIWGGAGCSGSHASTATDGVTMRLLGDNFARSQIVVQAGATLRLDDTTGGYHHLCLGRDMACNLHAAGPEDFQGNGLTISNGDVRSVVFSTSGTYEITCTIHPEMNLTVIVK
jgi:plastocyanin